MSRPPRPQASRSTGREEIGDLRRLDYLPVAYSDLLELEEELAVARMGRSTTPVAADTPLGADFARTFMELSALVGHVLAVYQRHYAGEAFLSTAQAPSSLVRHARRLAYDPDPGLAASGYAVLFAKEGVSGSVDAGLALASVPLGEEGAQDYETRDDVLVDAGLNELEPLGASRSVQVPAGADELRLEGVGHGIRAGDAVALVGPWWQGFVVREVSERADEEATVVKLDGQVTAPIDVAASSADPPRLLAYPARTLRPFGSGADAHLYPPKAVRYAGDDSKPSGGESKPSGPDSKPSDTATAPHYWYAVQRADGKGYDAADVYLSEQAPEPLKGAYVLRRDGQTSEVLRVSDEVVAAVALHRRAEESVTRHKVTVTPTEGSFVSKVEEEKDKQAIESHISSTVTAIQVSGQDPPIPVARKDHPFPADWLTGWTVEAPLAAREPNPEPLSQPLELPGQLAALTPGRALVFADRAGAFAQVVTVQRVELDETNDLTRLWWEAVTDPPPWGGWSLHDLRILGNVARVSHGRTVRETLGGSDGVTAFQRFPLRQSPVTVLSAVAGGEPQLEVRVDDVLWQPVEDFAASGPDDRHYRSETNEQSVTTVVFGDGRRGAVPPSGDRNVSAVYRVGLGRAGDIDPPRLSRLKRAHPLLQRAVNMTPLSGGAEPAEPEAIRSQSTRWIRTFDRAVSVSDLADLALTMPGVARAAARWDQASGAVLVVATARGEAHPAPDAVRAFLEARRDVSVPLELRGPAPRELAIEVSLEPDPAFLIEAVKDAVRDALHGERETAPGMFTFPARELGQPAFRSEVYARLEAVAGVVGVRITGFEALDEQPEVASDVVAAGVEQWLRLAPANLTLTVLGSAT